MIPWLFTIVGLVEAMYFINLAFGFVYHQPGSRRSNAVSRGHTAGVIEINER